MRVMSTSHSEVLTLRVTVYFDCVRYIDAASTKNQSHLRRTLI